MSKRAKPYQFWSIADFKAETDRMEKVIAILEGEDSQKPEVAEAAWALCLRDAIDDCQWWRLAVRQAESRPGVGVDVAA